MDWLEIAVTVPAEHVEAVCDALGGVAPGGASIEEPVVPLGPEEGVRYEPWRPSVVRVYLPNDARLAERRAVARAAVTELPFEVELVERSVREEDWANTWKEFFQIDRVSERLVIRPTWRAYVSGPDDVVLSLDPGMAFGTGQHETTRLCLVAIDRCARPGMRVLDVGCGSGILGIAAALLGAAAVDALDVEAVAVDATIANAACNGVAEIVRAAVGSLDDRWPFGPLPDGRYDVVLANIHAAATNALAAACFAALRPGGVLIASGIIEERLEEVTATLKRTGFQSVDAQTAGEWRAVIGRRSPELTPAEIH